MEHWKLKIKSWYRRCRFYYKTQYRGSLGVMGTIPQEFFLYYRTFMIYTRTDDIHIIQRKCIWPRGQWTLLKNGRQVERHDVKLFEMSKLIFFFLNVKINASHNSIGIVLNLGANETKISQHQNENKSANNFFLK